MRTYVDVYITISHLSVVIVQPSGLQLFANSLLVLLFPDNEDWVVPCTMRLMRPKQAWLLCVPISSLLM